MAFINLIKSKKLGGHERSLKAKKNIIALFLIRGCGFIGSNLAPEVLKRGEELVAFVK